MIKTRTLYLIYTVFSVLSLPFLVLRLLLCSIRNPGYRNHIAERFGFITATTKPTIWLHAVSVGETMAARTIISWLLSQYPDHTIMITNTTPTGADLVRQQWRGLVQQAYIPFDIPWFIKRVIKRCNIAICLIMETEIWPNLLRTCNQHDVPTLLVNARLSARSMQRYQKAATITASMLQNFYKIAAQTQADAQRFIDLGLPALKVSVTGNVKFDCVKKDSSINLKDQLQQQWRLHERLLWIAASTHEGEEIIVLEAFKKILVSYPDTLLLLVPRHPQRCESVVKICQAHHLNYARRSDDATLPDDCQVLLGDTLGELQQFFNVADIAFIGGSLVDVGGHNMIEPGLAGVPIVTGPVLHNFLKVSQLFIQAGAAVVVENEDELVKTIRDLLSDSSARKAMGLAAQEVIKQNLGASEKVYQIIADALSARDAIR